VKASPAHLDYLSQISRQLGVTDPVEEYYAPLVGKWSALRDEADRWRKAARVTGEVTDTLTKSLGGLDASWQGRDADSFMAYMQSYGLSGHDLVDAMNAMADALQQTADGVEHLVDQLGDALAESADTVSDALSVPVHGEKRAVEHLDDQHEPTKQLFESVRDVLEAFTKLCAGVHGGDAFSKITVKHAMPTSNWSYDYAPPAQPQTAAPVPTAPAASPAAPAPAAAHAAASAGGHAVSAAGHAGGASLSTAAAGITHDVGAAQAPGPGALSGVADQPAAEHLAPAPAPTAAPAAGAPGGQSGMGGMMGGMAGGQKGQGGEDTEHKSKIRLSGDLRDLLGKPEKTAPTVIGEN
jgi:uncharacterized protein YukE